MQEQIKAWATKFGLKTGQVEAGVGALLGFIQSKVPAAQWQQLQGLVPQAQQWMGKAASLPAAAQSATGGLMAQAVGLLGKLTGGSAGGLSDLMEKLQRAGFKPDSAMQFVSSVMGQIKAAAGPEKFAQLLGAVPALKDGLGGLGKFLNKP